MFYPWSREGPLDFLQYSVVFFSFWRALESYQSHNIWLWFAVIRQDFFMFSWHDWDATLFLSKRARALGYSLACKLIRSLSWWGMGGNEGREAFFLSGWRERCMQGACRGGSTQGPPTGGYGSAGRLCPASQSHILSLFPRVSFSVLVTVVTVTKSQSHGVALSPFWLWLFLLYLGCSWGFYCAWFCCSGASVVVCRSLEEEGAADIPSGLCFGSNMWWASKHRCGHLDTKPRWDRMGHGKINQFKTSNEPGDYGTKERK